MHYRIIALWVFLSATAAAATPLVARLDQPLALGRSVEWLDIGPEHPAYNESKPGPWMQGIERHQSNTDVINLSFTHHHYWFAIDLHNSQDQDQAYALEIATAWLDELEFFGASTPQRAGDLFERSAWTSSDRYPVFRWNLPAGATGHYWIRIASQDNLVVPLVLWDAGQYERWDKQRTLYYGLFYGLLLSIAVINAAMYLFSRRRTFLIYTLYISSYTLMQSALDGFLYAHISVISPLLINRLYSALTFSTVGFAGLFVPEFLQTMQSAPRLDKTVRGLAWCLLSMAFGSLVSPYYGLSIQGALLATLLYAPFALICVVHALRQRSRSAWFFAAAWTPLILAIILLALTAFRLFPPNIYTRSLVYFGIALEFIILSIGLGDQLQLSIKEHEIVKTNLEAAEAVQKALLPALPKIPGWLFHSWYQSAESTGGDWYEVIADPRHKRLYCLIGDVTGHGISSTLVTSAVAGTVHGFLDECFQQDISLDQTLEQLLLCVNRTVQRTGSSSGRLLTMNLLGIDLVTRRGLLLNAGHCHPLLIRQGEAHPLLSIGSMLGLSDQVEVNKKDFQLVKGDILLLYTDGLIHKHSRSQVELKLHRVMREAAKAPSAEAMIQLMKHRYQEVYGAQPQEDDCSLLAIEFHDDSEQIQNELSASFRPSGLPA